MTKQEFIKRECAIWGEDHIFGLIDQGYELKLLVRNGVEKWCWVLPITTTNHPLHSLHPLTSGLACATV